jgi:hypothetical protein
MEVDRDDKLSSQIERLIEKTLWNVVGGPGDVTNTPVGLKCMFDFGFEMKKLLNKVDELEAPTP